MPVNSRSTFAKAIQGTLAIGVLVATIALSGAAVAFAAQARPATPPALATAASVPPAPQGLIHLQASQTALWPTQQTILTAVTNYGVTGTPFWISIFDLTKGTYLAACHAGRVCTIAVTEQTPGVDDYVAALSLKPRGPSDYPPPGYLAHDVTSVLWKSVSVSLVANPTTVEVGSPTTLTATTSADLSSSPFFVQIYDTSTGTLVQSCGGASPCTATFTGSQAATDSFVAYVAPYATSSPLKSSQAESTTSYVTWSGQGFGLSLAVAPGTATATATVPQNPGPYAVEIFDETAGGALLSSCDSVAVCSVASTVAGHALVAVVSAPGSDTTLPPTDGQASSSVVTAI